MRARLFLSLVALVALGATGAIAPAEAQVLPLSAAPPAAVAAPAAPSINAGVELRRLEIAGDSGFLQGESASRAWPVFVKDSEIGRANILQIGFSASISDSPTVSRLHVFVNDRAVGEIELKGGERNVSRRLRLEPGALAPGLNAVRVAFESAHRVDCSPQATYELWARIDPSISGLMLTPPAHAASADPGRDLIDLMTARTAADGSTPIYVRSPLNPDPKQAARLIRVVDAMARSLRFVNPVVKLGPAPAGLAGVELAIGAREDLAVDKVEAQGRGRISVSDAESRPLVLLSGDDASAVEEQAQAFIGDLDRYAPTGSREGLRAAAEVSGVAVDGDRAFRLGDLGVDDDGGAGHGRRWERSATISLPQNFVPSVYAQAELRLKGSIPGGLSTGSAINVDVNGVGAASVPIAGDTPFDLEGQALYLPFSMFHPGVNKVTFEAISVAPGDAACETTIQTQRDALRVSPDSTLTFPHFARLQVGPDISRTLTARQDGDRVNVALIHPDRDSLGAAMTLLANLSVQGRRPQVDLTYGAPASLAQPGIAFGPIADMPADLARVVRPLYVEGGPAHGYGRNGANADAEPPMTAAEGAGSAGMGRTLWIKLVRNLRWLGFAFDDPSQRHRLIVRPDSVLIAEAPIGARFAQAGFAMPTIGAPPASWLIVASQSNEKLASGMNALIASDAWDQFHGQAAVFDPGANRVASLSRSRLFYTLPKDWTLIDLRDAMAVIFSDHAIAYVGVLLLLTTLLSATTAALIPPRSKDR